MMCAWSRMRRKRRFIREEMNQSSSSSSSSTHTHTCTISNTSNLEVDGPRLLPFCGACLQASTPFFFVVFAGNHAPESVHVRVCVWIDTKHARTHARTHAKTHSRTCIWICMRTHTNTYTLPAPLGRESAFQNTNIIAFCSKLGNTRFHQNRVVGVRGWLHHNVCE